jgi:hypothetical protein
MDTCSRLEEPGGVGWKDVDVGRFGRLQAASGRSGRFERPLDRIGGQGTWPARFCVAALGEGGRRYGEEVSNDDIMKGYKVDTDTYIEVSKDELENVARNPHARSTSTNLCRRAT